jgi:hypothetical protein
VAGALEMSQAHDRHEVTNVQARGAGVEPGIASHRGRGQCLGERFGVLMQ